MNGDKVRFIRHLQVVQRVSSSLSGHVVPPVRALSGRLKFTVRLHEFNKDSLFASSRRKQWMGAILLAMQTRPHYGFRRPLHVFPGIH